MSLCRRMANRSLIVLLMMMSSLSATSRGADISMRRQVDGGASVAITDTVEGGSSSSQEQAKVAQNVLGARAVRVIKVVGPGTEPICPSFAFAPLPGTSDLFVGKYKPGSSQGACDGGPVTLALFQLSWDRAVMTLLRPLMSTPVKTTFGTIENAYDPTAAIVNGVTWIAFECSGPYLPGTATCVAPLSRDRSRLEMERLSLPVAGVDADATSSSIYSASTPKLLGFGGKTFLYWNAIRSDKAAPHTWHDIEVRGAEMEVGTGGLWVAGRAGHPLPAHSPGGSVVVMSPRRGDPYSDTAVDTQGLYVQGDRIVVLSAVGGAGPTSATPCVRPHDRSPGCFRLEITRAREPLAPEGFRAEVLESPALPLNPVEYPRISMDPQGRTSLMVNTHPVIGGSMPGRDTALPTGYLLIDLPIQTMRFKPGQE